MAAPSLQRNRLGGTWIGVHTGDAPRSSERAARLRIVFIAVAVFLAALLAWAGRYSMNPDGIQYLDMADAIVRRDWAGVVNGLRSPLYPLAISVGVAVFRPDPVGEFRLVHYVNFALFLVSLVSFDFLLRELLRFRQAQTTHEARQQRMLLSPPAIVAIGFILLIWSSLNLTTMAAVAPDAAVAIFVYLAAGWLLRSRMQPERWAPFVLLGGALGLGYLAKAPMLPVAIVFFAVAVLWVPQSTAQRITRAALLPRVALAIAVFSIVVSPLVLGSAALKGRFTLGDAATLNYAWFINRVPQFHWQGGPAANGVPRHPTRMIASNPEAYEFATPIGGTYPPWYDPAYWYDGVVLHFDAWGHLWAVLRSLRVGSLSAVPYHWAPSVGLLVLLLVIAWRTGRDHLRDLAACWGLWVPAVFTFGMFSLVHLEPRYIQAFAVLLWLGVVSGLAFPAGPDGKAIARRLVAAILIVHGVFIASAIGMELARGGRSLFGGSAASASVDWQVAEGLKTMGLQPGDKVAILGRGAFAYWARLARVQIVGEIPVTSESHFWAADAQVRRTILRRFAAVGAKMIVLPPPETRRREELSKVDPSAMGWRRVGQTEYYAMPLAE